MTNRTRASIVFAGTMLVRLALLPILPIPTPQVHDEFSYLLGADTFASGRVTNPQHPLWIFFESFHIIQQPTYQSKYPPLQAAFLALGQVLFGQPWFGALLAASLMSASLCWMLQGWLPPRWGFAGAMIGGGYIGVLSYWTNSYWGGTVAALGGCLVLGALPRLLRGSGPRDVFWACLGIAVLANSRPFEGLLLTVACAAAIVVWGRPSAFRLQWMVPAVAVLIPAFAWMGYYDWRVTGKPLLLPYQLHESQYATTTAFRFLPYKQNSPVYHHAVMEQYWKGWEIRETKKSENLDYRRQDGRGVPLTLLIGLCAFAVPLLASLLAWRRREFRVALFVTILFGAGLALERTILLHYAAPGLGLIFIFLVTGMRQIRALRNGALATRAIAAILLAGFPAMVWAISSKPHVLTVGESRAEVIEKLRRYGGEHLVIVRYSSHHNVHSEWVFNRADIDRADVVWARDMGAAKNARLLAYFNDRHVWLLQPDDGRQAIEPYRDGATAAVTEEP